MSQTAAITTAELEAIQRRRSRFWMVAELFEIAKERKLHSPGWEPFSRLIAERTSRRIPPGSLKYWYAGHSTPRIDEVDLMATALDHELELIQIPEKS